ncbi:hypothetical protein QR680_012288 [Steinernema hermaphroditum]|uniref:EGF-like domain-containing protein n=1 Tax=Steinernema hermaphroditum TaxID=289476 RepID=A0AA39I417_9BILA|nr:hypothetical protein QR680_012288 [Steinernema hermaphroditum]
MRQGASGEGLPSVESTTSPGSLLEAPLAPGRSTPSGYPSFLSKISSPMLLSLLLLLPLLLQVAANPCFNGGRQRHLRRPGHRHRHRRADIHFPKSPFFGDENEIAIDEELMGGKMHCLCDYRYEGIRCEHRVFPCGHGKKVRQPGSVREYCSCDAEWTGEDCVTPVCHNGIVDEHSRRCLCAQGWTGTHCNIPVCGLFGAFVGDKCECEHGYEGIFCERSRASTFSQAATWSAAFSFPLALIALILKMRKSDYPKINNAIRSNESMKSLISIEK